MNNNSAKGGKGPTFCSR